MKNSFFTILLFGCMFSLQNAYTQTYEWQWALHGGGNHGSGGFDYTSEQIYDVKVGTDNNYYFIGTLQGKNMVQLNGTPVTTYNSTMGGNDIFIFSTTCDGTVRWSQAIGGKDLFDASYKVILDNQNNVYAGVFVGLGDAGFPVHFSPNDALPGPPQNSSINSDFYKTGFLLKYDTNGNLKKREPLQGSVNGNNFSSQILDLAIDSNNNLHFIIGLSAGSHLNGNVTVPAGFINYSYQYYLVKYDQNLNYVSSILLPIPQGSLFFAHYTCFAYDETLNRYYISGNRSVNITGQPSAFMYDGKAIVNRNFLLAINGSDGSELWRREIYSDPVNGSLASNIISSIAVDSNSDVYLAGLIWTTAPNQEVKIYDPNHPTQTTYTFNPPVYTNIPLLTRLNSNGTVQWTKTPTAFAANYTSNTSLEAKGITFNGNEVALSCSDAYFKWDSFSLNHPKFYMPDPVLLRFSKQTGITLGMHDIKGASGSHQFMTAVAADLDGNYIVGGAFSGSLFTGTTPASIAPMVSTGHYDLFVAKLGASPCGTAAGTDVKKLNVTVYPNPANELVYIETDETLYDYEIYNTLGQKLLKDTFKGASFINLHSLANGTYFVKLTTQQGSSATVKIIKKQ